MAKEAEEKEKPPFPTRTGKREPEDKFYQGTITRIFWSSKSGVIQSDSGREIPFGFPLVTLLGTPQQDLRYLREGMRVGFDVGWTSKGLRVTVIKVYEDLKEEDEP